MWSCFNIHLELPKSPIYSAIVFNQPEINAEYTACRARLFNLIDAEATFVLMVLGASKQLPKFFSSAKLVMKYTPNVVELH